MPEYLCLRCCNCKRYVVQQRKKVKKWQCMLCRQKQSLKHIYGISNSAKDIRLLVQDWNMSRGEDEENWIQNIHKNANMNINNSNGSNIDTNYNDNQVLDEEQNKTVVNIWDQFVNQSCHPANNIDNNNNDINDNAFQNENGMNQRNERNERNERNQVNGQFIWDFDSWSDDNCSHQQQKQQAVKAKQDKEQLRQQRQQRHQRQQRQQKQQNVLQFNKQVNKQVDKQTINIVESMTYDSEDDTILDASTFNFNETSKDSFEKENACRSGDNGDDNDNDNLGTATTNNMWASFQ